MRIISFIEDGRIIRKILAHLGLWETRLVRAKRSVASNHDPPMIKDSHISCGKNELTYAFNYSQLPPVDYWVE
jgi:hypothetical protein